MTNPSKPFQRTIGKVTRCNWNGRYESLTVNVPIRGLALAKSNVKKGDKVLLDLYAPDPDDVNSHVMTAQVVKTVSKKTALGDWSWNDCYSETGGDKESEKAPSLIKKLYAKDYFPLIVYILFIAILAVIGYVGG